MAGVAGQRVAHETVRIDDRTAADLYYLPAGVVQVKVDAVASGAAAEHRASQPEVTATSMAVPSSTGQQAGGGRTAHGVVREPSTPKLDRDQFRRIASA